MNQKLSRRSFLKASTLAGGGFMLQMTMPAALFAEDLPTLVGSAELNAYIKISSDGTITIYSAIPEMGQGIKTALPMIVAEEMGASWEDVVVLQSAVDEERYGRQGAGGSTSIPRNFDTMREMGASAREMLIGAASESMEVPKSELKAQNSEVVHISGTSLTFGQLAALAVRQPIPEAETLVFRDPDDYTIIGTSVSNVDNLVIVTGNSDFGIDTVLPGMKYATYFRCPRLGGEAISFNEAEIKALAGVTDAFLIKGKGQISELRSGIAIVGDDSWSVMKAREKLKVEWDYSNASDDSWQAMQAAARSTAEKGGGVVQTDLGDVEGELANENNTLHEAFYEFGFVSHLCMEPMNCTAQFIKGSNGDRDQFEVWAPTQAPPLIKSVGAKLFDGIEESDITIHQRRMGGGFGRRFATDFAMEAMAISQISGFPVKLTWTRTDDIHHDLFRAGGFQNLKAALSPEGKLVAWDQHYMGFTRNGQRMSGSGLRGGEMPAVVMPTVRTRQSMVDIGTPCGPWRAPGSNTNAFVEQSFIHELAELAGRDHLEFLIEILGERRWVDEGNVRALNTGRAIDVIKIAAKQAGWGREMPKGRGLGLAFYFSHAGHIAEVADVSVDAKRNYTVHKVTVAVDVGPIINRSGALTQVQGSVIDGISAMAAQQITMENGEIQQDNLHQYPVIRLPQVPEVDVHFLESDNPPTGLGEPALPPVVPAVTNAIYAASGIRVRTTPLSLEGFNLV